MSLQKYVRQVKPRNESLIPPVDKVQSFLTEGSAADATNGEKAICFAYNHYVQKMEPDEALQKAAIEKLPSAAKWSTLVATGKAVVEDSKFGNRGDYLIHAGTSSAATHYDKGVDTTSKSDLYINGNTTQNISLKKQGDKGEGAQLMSAKSGEAAGVFSAAMEHHKKVDGVDISKNSDFIAAMKILEEKMDETSTNRLNVEVSSGKKDFGTWYVENSTRAQDLRSKYRTDRKIKDKDIVNFLKGELSLVGAAVKKLRNDKEYVAKLPDETPVKDKKALDPYVDEYVKDSSWDVGGAPKSRTDKDKGVKVSAGHFFKGGKGGTSTAWAAGVDSDIFKSEALKSQVRDVIHTAIDNKGWQEELTKFFTDNVDLKKWMVYEAASGLYKFTGQASTGKAYPGTQREVANKILVFSDNGFVKEYTNLVDYGANNTNLVDNVSVSYKGTGRSKESVVRMATSYEPKGEFSLLEEILNEETPCLQQEIYQIERSYLLSEGIFRNAINKVKKFASHVADLLKSFYEKVIKKFVTKLYELAKGGITKFLEALGLEVEGDLSMKTPSW